MKLANGEHDLNLPAEGSVNWTYQVANTGNVALSGVGLVDDPSVALVGPNGDANGNGLLDVGETWTYSAAGTAVEGDYTNTATVTATATDATGTVQTSVSAQDTDHYFGVLPGIEIDKLTNGVHNPNVPAGSEVTWTYNVSNTGNVALAGVTVDGRSGRHAGLPVGDDNGNRLLDPGEVWTYTATGIALPAVIQPYANIGHGQRHRRHRHRRQSGQRQRHRRLFRRPAGDRTDKTHQQRSRSERSRRQRGHVDLRGEQHRQRALSGVTVTDDRASMPVYQSGDDGNGVLDPGEVWIYTATGMAIAGQYTNTAPPRGVDATGTVADSGHCHRHGRLFRRAAGN